jgi:membrane protein implicated in regulation of membrane protease activity
MNVPAIFMGDMIASAAIPAPALLVGPVHAWVLVLTLLALCCGILWAITRPVRAQQATPARRRSRGRAADGRRGTLLNAGGRQERRPMSVVSGASTGSSPPFNAAGIGGITG